MKDPTLTSTPHINQERRPANGTLISRFWPNWISRDMSLILLARAGMSTMRGLAGVLTPIYLALIGFSALRLGLLFTVVGLTSTIFTLMIGFTSDRIGRKIFLIVLPVMAAGAGVVFALTTNVTAIFIAAALGTFGRGAGAGAGAVGPYMPAESALLAEKVAPRYRNSLFGRAAFAANLGALLGGGLLATLPDVLPHFHVPTMTAFRIAYGIAAVLSLVSGLIVLPIADARPVRAPRTSRQRGVIFSRATWGILIKLGVTNAFNGTAVGFFGPFITYWLFRRYGAGPAAIGLLFSIINIATLVSNLGAAGLARRFGLVRAIVFGRILQAILIVPMVLAPTFWLAGMVYLVRMLAQRVALPLRQSYVMGVIPNDERASASALSNLPSQLTMSVSPSIAGAIFDTGQLALPFEIGALLQLINALLFGVFFNKLRPPEEDGDSAPAESAS